MTLSRTKTAGASAPVFHSAGNLHARTWLVWWHDGARDYLLKTDFDTALDLGNALLAMHGGEVERSFIEPWPRDGEKFKAICVKLKETRDYLRARNRVFPDKRNLDDWRACFSAEGAEMPMV